MINYIITVFIRLLLTGFIVIASIYFFTNDMVFDYMVSINNLLEKQLPIQILIGCGIVVGGTVVAAGDVNN